MANTLNLGNGNWATKKDSLLAYNSENGNFKPLAFDFTRNGCCATVVNKAGLIETVGGDIPRIDFSNDAKGALLLEPTRSNLVTYSENLSNWTQDGATTLDNNIISPDGTLNASKITFNSGNERVYTFTNTTNGSFSAYFKGVQGKKVKLRDNSGTYFTEITLTENWVRYYLYKETSNTNIQIQNIDANDVNVWGAQVEEGSYATSYIPTQGSAVTRVADACSQTPPTGVIGQTEGTLFTEFEFNYSDSNTQVLLKANQSSDANSVGIEILGTTIKGLVNSQSSSIANIQGTIAIGTIKAAIAYKTNDIAFYVNGVQVGVITSGSISFAGVVDILTIGHFSLNGGQYFPASRPFNQTQIYNTRLSNAELQALTS